MLIKKTGAPDNAYGMTQTYCPDGATTNLAFTASTAQSAVLVAATAAPQLFQLYATQDCFVAFGTSPTASNTTGSQTVPIKAGVYLPFDVLPGYRIAAIRSTADGVLYITACTV